MFKIHLIQQWYNLSDRETEFQICDRLSFRKFLGLGIEDNVSDATTIEKEYKNRIIAKERARVEHIFAALKRIFKFTRLRYRGLERVTTKFESLIIAYNFYRLGFLMRTREICA